MRQPKIDMSYQDFGNDLLDTGDLDPVYVMLVDAEMAGVLHGKMFERFLLAYWCYYSCGVAARIAESSHFYKSMRLGLAEKWPRGMERRYFYGKSALDLVNGLEDAGEPERIVDDMCAHYRFKEVFDNVVKYKGFGPWMGWKIADMAERVLSYPVDFTDSEIGIYKDPVQGAAWIDYGDKHYPITMDQLHVTCDRMVGEFDNKLAPPWNDRPVNIQEVETILCKYKAHCYGFYPMGNDTIHVTKGLSGWGDLAEELIKFMPVYPDE